MNSEIRTFASGATRDSDAGKLDYEGFLSPLALRAYAEYMHKHREQSDGELRESDNWQKGFPDNETVKSLFRHFIDVWSLLRGWPAVGSIDSKDVTLKDALCAVTFGTMSLLHQIVEAELGFEPPTRQEILDAIPNETSNTRKAYGVNDIRERLSRQ